jgi:hypothetical protein
MQVGRNVNESLVNEDWVTLKSTSSDETANYVTLVTNLFCSDGWVVHQFAYLLRAATGNGDLAGPPQCLVV